MKRVNFMADPTLQAFQLGASLFDRAQTQARIMEQMKLQTAESLLQQRGMQLQNQIRDITLAEALGEQEAQVAEFKAFSDLSKQVGEYLDNPSAEAKFPVVPAFRSKQFRLEADKMLNNLERYSARAKLLRARDRADATSDGIAASTINKAIDLGALIRKPDGSWDIDVKVLNERSEELRKANLAKTTAQTTGVLGNLDVARGKLKVAADNLERLTREDASQLELEKAKFEFKQALDTEEALLKEKRLELDRTTAETKASQQNRRIDLLEQNINRLTNEMNQRFNIEQQKVDISKENLTRLRADSDQRFNLLKERNELARLKLIQSATTGEKKLNAVDDKLVKKAADDIANKQTISDAIGYEIGILEDPNINEYVRLNSARMIAKVLNSAEGKDAVGAEEAKRILQELELVSGKRALEGGPFFGPDIDSFVEKIKLKKGELDIRIKENMGRVNNIYNSYGIPLPAGTSSIQTATTTNAPVAVQQPATTNAPVAVPSFKTINEAKAAGVKPGTKVIINGISGTIK